MMPIAIAAAAVVAVAVGILAVRRARISGAVRTRTGYCQECGRPGPVMAVSFHQNTGMLVARQHRRVAGELCRGCSLGHFLKTTLHNLVLGWWGTISFLVTPFFILNNLAYGLAAATLPGTGALARRALDEQRDYALNLLATKDRETVVEVLVRQTGASPEDVRAWLGGLGRAA